MSNNSVFPPELWPAEPTNKRTAEARTEDRFPAHPGGARLWLTVSLSGILTDGVKEANGKRI